MAQPYIPTFEDWNRQMEFQGSTDARGKSKYYNNFLRTMEKTPKNYEAMMNEHGFADLIQKAPSGGGSMPTMPFGPSGPSQGELDKIQADKVEKERVTQGGVDRDSALSVYNDAAGAAGATVDGVIAQERAGAALSGTDYMMTDQMRQDRVDNYFSTIYNESDQSNLQNLYDEFGAPEGGLGYEDFITKRGVGQAIDPNAPAAPVAAPSTRPGGGQRSGTGTLATGRPEENSLGTTSILGG